ncbi:MAG: hypothetical protein JO250_21385 [Armatimonadetes bacterium]|nr:hypothetical protein [Armatimonadota bacterium]
MLPQTFFAVIAAALAVMAARGAAAPSLVLTVDAGHILRQDADRFVGVNLNYIRDSDANRPHARPLKDALRDLGARWLRYPGGEKSDFYLWSQPPYDKPRPVSLGWYGTVAGRRMDFDQYIAAARAARAEPYVVVGYTTAKASGRTEAQWLENAVAWVKYANVERKYGVRYWEIGNENWNNGKAVPEDMARIVTEFSRAMKAVDPTIQVGASGNGDGWWSKFLPTAAPALDFISLSLYNCWGWKSYDHFATLPAIADTIGDAETALNAIDRYAPPADRPRLRVIVSETNSKDYSEDGWPGANTLGHALVTFDTLGRVMAQPRVLTAMVWTTRWMNDAEARDSQWYALGPDNEILPTGRAIALWGQFVQKDMIAADGGSDHVVAYASRSADGRRVTVWVLNRGYERADGVRIIIRSTARLRHAAVYQLTGTGPDDPSPHWGQLGAVPVSGNTVSNLSCPGVSVTVLSLR